MALIKDDISGFIGGVSQQPDKLMFPNQSKSLINMNPDPISGNSKRKPTQHIKRLMNALLIHPQTHTIIKEDERYNVYLTGNNISVFDLDGNEKTVYYGSNGEDDEAIKQELLKYVTTNNPLKDLAMTTIGDYTFILNKTVAAELSDENYPNPYPSSALIFVKQGDYSIDYNVTINDVQVAAKTTSDTSKADLKTNSIAQALYDQMVTELGTTEWKFSKLNSTILIQRLDGKDFKIRTSDSNSDRNLFTFYKETENFTSLPVVAPNGFVIKITGNNGDTSDDYYVQFSTTDGTDFGSGVWKECCSPDVKYHIKPESMPHALVREADGSFTFKRIDWTDRKSGDEDTAKTPSLFGNRVQEVFTHKGRLACLASDRSIYSDTEDIFSFFKRTVLTKLDTDPIDVSSNSKMVLLKHSLPLNNDLLLFSPSAIFTISGGDMFSNSTVTIDLTKEYPCSSLCKPISLGDMGLFVYENGNYSGIYEIYPSSSGSIAVRSITEQIPCYLPQNIYKLTGSTQNNIMCLFSKDEADSIYVYNYYYSSETKVQSAWHKWTLNGKILSGEFVDNNLYLTVQYDDGVYLEKINVMSKQEENNLDFLVHLDRKAEIQGNYNIETNITTFTMPYTPIKEITVVDPKTGFSLDYDSEGNVLEITGDYSQGVIVGNTYKSLWELGTIYKRQQTSSGASKVIEGLLMLGDIDLTYLNSCEFKVRVTPAYTSQTASTYSYSGIVAGTSSALLGKVTPHSDSFLVPIMARNEDVKIEVINDGYLPCCFVSLTWLGEFNIRGQ